MGGTRTWRSLGLFASTRGVSAWSVNPPAGRCGLCALSTRVKYTDRDQFWLIKDIFLETKHVDWPIGEMKVYHTPQWRAIFTIKSPFAAWRRLFGEACH